jgi:DNA-binding response OmpR family regulator
LVDRQDVIAVYRLDIGTDFRVHSTPLVSEAIDYIRRRSPALVITELDLQDGSGLDVCRAANTLPMAPTVLVTAERPDRIPDALAAGCDSVLLKPFAPNLLISRVGRLLRDRADQLQLATARALNTSAHSSEQINLLRTGTNRVWPNTHCPHCGHGGVTSFDFVSMRRAWYACLECKQVWIAKRQE